MRETLLHVLTAERIQADLTALLHEDDAPIELDGRALTIPKNAPLEIVARSFHTYQYEIGFGDHYRALVAVGGVRSVEHGVPVAELCFATLWYNGDVELLSIDFSAQMP